VIAHKLVFSLSQDERDRLGIDLKQMVRDIMSAWEAKLGQALNWIGFHHEDKGHPHVHVVVGGYAGGGKQIGIYERDLHWMRDTAERSKESLSHQQERELTPQQDASRLHRQMEEHHRTNGRFLDRILGKDDRGWDRGR
jgi:type IV secretory pathway VirD2 relaxase